MFSAATKTDNVSSAANYVEDVFSTWLYTGTSANQTITNGIDLSGKGGLVWTRARSSATRSPILFDTARGAGQRIYSDNIGAETSEPAAVSAFNANGYNLGADSDVNLSGTTFVSWTLREQSKFFDIVTYTGNGVNRTISHNLGSVPGCIIIKRRDTSGAWQVYHRSLANTEYLVLNTTAAKATGATRWNSTTPTSTVFSLGTDATVNANGGTYVAYLFAHDAGGFGAAGADNVISCGSYTTNGSGQATITLGYEPQWVFVKASSTSGNWVLFDTMRGISVGGGAFQVLANALGAESDLGTGVFFPTATGFQDNGALGNSTTFVYIAIRRGPMKTPTSGTSVFSPQAVTARFTYTTNFPVDLVFAGNRAGDADNFSTFDRLRGGTALLRTSATSAESAISSSLAQVFDSNTQSRVNYWTSTSFNLAVWNFGRAPGFFDVVCYTGTGANRTVTHNLTVAPELIITKDRTTAQNWFIYAAPIGNTRYLQFDTSAQSTFNLWQNTNPTSTVFSLSTDNAVNRSGDSYVAYLFASCPGVSKVGSYTGTGALQTINCGFAAGARFVLIKRTDSTGSWWVYDSARGITSGNDPYLFLNSTAAEVTNTNYVDTASTGFQVTAAAPAGLNANGGTYIFLAIA